MGISAPHLPFSSCLDNNDWHEIFRIKSRKVENGLHLKYKNESENDKVGHKNANSIG
jgi:hypothetical protein